MRSAREVVHRLPAMLTIPVGVLVFQFLVMPLSQGTGGWRWPIVGIYLLLLSIVVTYFGVRARARERRSGQGAGRRQRRQAPGGSTDLAG